jgi:hypothetical protein
LQRLVAEIGLTDDQAARVDTILRQAVMDRRAIRAGFGDVNVLEMWSELRLATTRADHQLETMLSKRQFSKFIAYRNRLRQDRLRMVDSIEVLGRQGRTST